MREENRDINASSSMLASLNGKRIAFTSELRKKDRIAEAPFKKLIGGGKITAREVYKPVEEFDMTATLMIDSNYLPSIESADDVEAYAIKRRMTIIPFNHRFGPEDRDVTLPRKLRDYQVQEAILAWMIDGAWAYLDFGLRPTPEMQYALETYMLLENSVIGFFHNCIIIWYGTINPRSMAQNSCRQQDCLKFILHLSVTSSFSLLFTATLSSGNFFLMTLLL